MILEKPIVNTEYIEIIPNHIRNNKSIYDLDKEKDYKSIIIKENDVEVKNLEHYPSDEESEGIDCLFDNFEIVLKANKNIYISTKHISHFKVKYCLILNIEESSKIKNLTLENFDVDCLNIFNYTKHKNITIENFNLKNVRFDEIKLIDCSLILTNLCYNKKKIKEIKFNEDSQFHDVINKL